MMTIKKLLLLAFSVLFLSISAQLRTFVYEIKYKSNPNKDSIITLKMNLDVMDKQSVFRTDKQKETDSIFSNTGRWTWYDTGFGNQLYISKNLKTKEIFKNVQNARELYTIPIKENLQWKILPDKDKAGEFAVQKATTNYGGRNWTAWFATEIPILDGPHVFSGLPGLIVKIEDEKKDYQFALTEIKKSGKQLFQRGKGLVLTWAQFQKLAKDYYNDPFKEYKAGQSKLRVVDEHGNVLPIDYKDMTLSEQKQIRETNNPVELNYKISYP
ncbi:GLPGLI family protein [Elizabethkingia ursingii]|uniref:GLPGLI family protein n=1 Tax=Elizabethkingia ursingii TaxID=1756150 RepID=UPI0020133F53|nr:GLPGLI family protein [Elizabethkingia ursingii]MCL1662794.1 GLPGLI family protein [Elizabethkingia ursingii]